MIGVKVNPGYQKGVREREEAHARATAQNANASSREANALPHHQRCLCLKTVRHRRLSARRNDPRLLQWLRLQLQQRWRLRGKQISPPTTGQMIDAIVVAKF